MRYFANRMQAGRMLASRIADKYGTEPCAVIALSDGGVMVGVQIAVKLQCVLTMLLVDEIDLPREPVSIAGISQNGTFTYNSAYSKGEIDELVSEYYGVIEQKKLEKLHQLHEQLGNDTLIRRDLLRHKNVIVVADGIENGFLLDLAMDYLKPIAIKKLIVATPMATIAAVDRMHILADDIFCLSVPENYMGTDHYYDTQDVPSHDAVLKSVAQVVRGWTKPQT
ncbi:MAG TPA: phosphoribosyltransferase family protein [Candidatus Saccharimonadales bacterium]|nr:phosphoribosyltransferase family protein [Candidatus Saccharimonadales bacterium]